MADTKTTSGLPVHTFLIEPFDIGLFASDDGFSALHSNFSSWLGTLSDETRFVCFQLPISLDLKIAALARQARLAFEAGDQRRADLCQEIRRHYELLQRDYNYQRSLCGVALWSEASDRALESGLRASFTPNVSAADWPSLFSGEYTAVAEPFWHLSPYGVQKGRPYWAILTSFELKPAVWSFYQPLQMLLAKQYPIAYSAAIQSWDRNKSVGKVESIMQAYGAHLKSATGVDSRSEERYRDCRRTLDEISSGDNLHRVTMSFAVSATSLPELKTRIDVLINEAKPFFGLRMEVGEMLMRSVGMFAPIPIERLRLPDTAWPLTSREVSMTLSPLGYPKLTHTHGVLRGDSINGNYPLFYDDWHKKDGTPDRRCVHEVWVGMSGFGKTFYGNTLLGREYAEAGVPFDLLEPMGHGQKVAKALDVPLFVIGPRTTKFNPQDIMMTDDITNQVSHVIRLYETMLNRPLSSSRVGNLERGFLSQTLHSLYEQYSNWRKIPAADAPTCDDVVSQMAAIAHAASNQQAASIAADLAQEIDSVACGNGPFAGFVNGHTSIDLSSVENNGPRVFSFHQLGSDPIMMGIAYTQVLAAIGRDALADDRPRIIMVDETYRLMRHPSLLAFLIEAAKTFRTRRKKLICIDQNMSVFLEGPARLIFENAPIRLIFNQSQGLGVFSTDAAFQHFNAQDRDMIAKLKRFEFVLDIQDEGRWLLRSNPSYAEFQRYQNS